MTINTIVWGENVHEQTNPVVAQVYPGGMHKVIADALNKAPGISATTATLQETDHGLTVDRLAKADVLLWWGHAAHGEVEDRIVERVAEAVCWHGLDRSAFRPFRQNLQAVDGHAVQFVLARGR